MVLIHKYFDKKFLERCPSGRRSTPGKCVSFKRASWVRIPLSPPDKIHTETKSFKINVLKLFLLVKLSLEAICGENAWGNPTNI
jgi:hypothetical protein